MTENEKYRQDFLSGMSYKAIAEKYNVDENFLIKVGRDEGWYKERQNRVKEKTNQQMLEEATAKLCKCLERAIKEIDSYVTTVKKKEKSLEYDEDGKKVINETVIDSETIEIVKGVVDRSALKQLIAALSALKGEECIEDSENGIFVIMSEEAKEYAK